MTEEKARPVVLFLCTGNSARSQIGEAMLRHLAGDWFDARSAGTEPAGFVHPLALEVLKEEGIEVAGLRSKHAREFLGVLPVRHLVAVCDAAAKSCPAVWPGVTSRHAWPLPDPAAVVGDTAARKRAFREVRDALRARILEWLSDQEKKS